MLTQRAPPQVKALLFGLPNSTLKLHMRRQDGSSYDVIAMRHMAMTQAGLDEIHQRQKPQQHSTQSQRTVGSQGAVRSTPGSGYLQQSTDIYRSQDSYNASIYRSASNASEVGNPWVNAISNFATALRSPPLGAEQARTASISPLSMFSSPPIGSSTGPSATYGGQVIPSYHLHTPQQQVYGLMVLTLLVGVCLPAIIFFSSSVCVASRRFIVFFVQLHCDPVQPLVCLRAQPL